MRNVARSLSRVHKSSMTARCAYSLILNKNFHNNHKNNSADYTQWTSMAVAAAIGLTAAAHVVSSVDCCGIVGYIGDNNAQPILMDGIKILQNRGYDSAGMGTIDSEGRIHITKYASKGTTSDSIDILAAESPKNHSEHRIGIAHTRWATHGGKVDKNAHPHMDSKNTLMLVHNGTIVNYQQLKKMLIDKGFTFKSETDTEVIANLISSLIDEGFQFEKAVEEATNMLQGTWGLVVLHKNFPDRLVVSRNGSPILIGSNGSEVFIASEQAALAQHTSHFITLRDGETAVVTRDGIKDLISSRNKQKVHVEDVRTSPAPFQHWTQREIHEQPQSLARALNYGGRLHPSGNKVKLGGLDAIADELKPVDELLISACGTSLFAGMYGQLLMEWLHCFHCVRAIDASEVNADNLPRKSRGEDNVATLFISQSGETLDVLKAVALTKQHGLKLLSVVNVVGSQLSRETGCGVYLNAGREVAVASTKAFTSQVTVLALIASWFADLRRQTETQHNQNASAGSSSVSPSLSSPNSPSSAHESSGVNEVRHKELMDAIHRLPVLAGMTLQCDNAMLLLANRLKDATDLFVLGKGFAHPVALEGALKIKEISYIHAEGFAGGALKHGPFALLDSEKRTPVIMIINSDEHVDLMLNAAEQVNARGAELIVITDDPSCVSSVCKQENIIAIPSNGPLTALLAVIPLQLLAYHLAVLRGYNPDFPRGLAKTVTVL
eukprot:GDKJ01032989.1.p1 GENE.GDKJ01032989.1~~GDKJ01032989.1.p1  ORF type:complete len:723 (+),score=172.20 GDKJ01032989.1:32-2200(+)